MDSLFCQKPAKSWRFFCANPKKYMFEVFHTYHHRILIVGGPLTGKTELAKRLSMFFESEIVEFPMLLEETRQRVPVKEDEDMHEKDGSKPESESAEEYSSEAESTVPPIEQPSESTDDQIDDSKLDTPKRETGTETQVDDTETKVEDGDEEKKESNPEEKEKKDEVLTPKKKQKREPPPPIYFDGYISVVTTFEAQQFKIFQKVEGLAPAA
jgi:hypothetical protein